MFLATDESGIGGENGRGDVIDAACPSLKELGAAHDVDLLSFSDVLGELSEAAGIKRVGLAGALMQ